MAGSGMAGSGAVTASIRSARARDVYPSNTALYADLVEGVDYRRRFDAHPSGTAVIAPHGGDIEEGTSELCLAIAGYHPATLVSTTPAYGYWMFEGVRPDANGHLHVTSVRCDDPLARALCGGCAHALSVHGCLPSSASLADDAPVVLVGGRDVTFRRYLLAELRAAGFDAFDASAHATLGGVARKNIVNRTLLGMGAQLELTAPLRAAMFEVDTREGRPRTTTRLFWDLVRAARTAVTRVEAARPAPVDRSAQVGRPAGQATPVPPIPQ